MRYIHIVITCLDCGKRVLKESVYRSVEDTMARYEKDGCTCGSKELVAYKTVYHANARKLSELPLRREFRLMHGALKNKLKVIELIKRGLDLCSASVAAAELADDTAPLKEIARWLRAIAVEQATQTEEETKVDGQGLPPLPL
jgi:DNA-directed RNA polymerase subunit RPC12/RpoP